MRVFRSLTVLMLVVALAGCLNSAKNDKKNIITAETKEVVTIQKKSTHYEVTVNFKNGSTIESSAEEYGKKILQLCPDYETLLDSYLQELILMQAMRSDEAIQQEVQQGIQNEGLETFSDLRIFLNEKHPELVPAIYNTLISNSKLVLKNTKQEYVDEIAGVSKAFTGKDTDVLGDGKLSHNEYLLINFMTDVFRPVQCSAVSVFGNYSENNKTIIGRNLDWYIGSERQLSKLSAVITYKKNGKHSICNVGFLGFIAVVTGYNDSGLFMATLDSGTNAPQTDFGKISSYTMNIRECLEVETNIDTGYQMFLNKDYAYNFNITFADKNSSKVFECNISGNGSNMRRALRAYDSELNPGITWGIPNAVGAVNSFLLKGNCDNFTGMDEPRWNSIKSELTKKGSKVSFDELKEVIAYHKNAVPGDDASDLFVADNCHSIVFQPEDLKTEIAFMSQSEGRKTPVFEVVQSNF